MSSLFKPSVRRALNLNTSDSSQGIFGGDSNVLKNLEESKKINTLVKSSLLQTKKAGKAGGKSGKNKGKKPAAWGSKAKGKKGFKNKKAGKNKAKKNSDNSKDKEASKEKEKNDPCKLVTQESITSSHPSSPGSCGCKASTDNTVSSIPWGADWLISFLLQSATE